MLTGLLLCCAAMVRSAPPLPPRQTNVQREVIQRVQRAAPAESASATAEVLAFLDDKSFRAGLKRCLDRVRELRIRVGCLLQGSSDAELPECLLGAESIAQANISQIR